MNFYTVPIPYSKPLVNDDRPRNNLYVVASRQNNTLLALHPLPFALLLTISRDVIMNSLI